VVAFVFIIGMINVSLGFALAIYLERLTAPERDIVILPEAPTTSGDESSDFGTSALPSSGITSKAEQSR